MIPLAILAVIAGWFEHSFVEFVTKTLPTWEAHNLSHSTEWMLILVTSAIAIGGVYLQYLSIKMEDLVNLGKRQLFISC